MSKIDTKLDSIIIDVIQNDVIVVKDIRDRIKSLFAEFGKELIGKNDVDPEIIKQASVGGLLNSDWQSRNRLRVEQRKKLEEILG